MLLIPVGRSCEGILEPVNRHEKCFKGLSAQIDTV